MLYFCMIMKSTPLKSDDILFKSRKTLEEQIIMEVKLLKEFNPDKDLITAFEYASLIDLQKHLDD